MTAARNWRQVPEIQEAKRVALALRSPAAIVLYITEDGEFGYASYGTNGARCKLAGEWADVAYEAIVRHVEAAP